MARDRSDSRRSPCLSLGWWCAIAEPSGKSNRPLVWRSAGEVLNVQLRDRTTAADALGLLDSLCDQPRRGPIHVALDLSAVMAIDRPAAHAILDAYVNTTLRGGTFRLVGLAPAVRDSLQDAGVLEVVARPAASPSHSTPSPQLRLVRGNQVAFRSATQVTL